MLFWFFAAFKSDDELFHVEMYQWLLTEKQYERLLAVRSPYLEDFLTRGELHFVFSSKNKCLRHLYLCKVPRGLLFPVFI